MNRRQFLKVALTATAVTVVPVSLASALAEELPVIYGDGVHDDTKALQAVFDGKPFVCPDGNITIVNGHIHCMGRYRITGVITFRGDVTVQELIMEDNSTAAMRNDHLTYWKIKAPLLARQLRS